MAICAHCGNHGSVLEIRNCALNGIPHEGAKVPKAIWGDGLSEKDIDNASDSMSVYEGEIPPSGPYRFKVRTMKKTTSKAGNPMVSMMVLLDDPRKDIMKKFGGCPVFATVTVTPQTDFQVKRFTRALGISSADFLKRTVVDEDENILKFGTKKIKDADVYVKINAKKERRQGEDDGMRLAENGFMPLVADKKSKADAEPDEKPAKAKKAKVVEEEAPAPAAKKAKGDKAPKNADEARTQAAAPGKKAKAKKGEPPF